MSRASQRLAVATAVAALAVTVAPAALAAGPGAPSPVGVQLAPAHTSPGQPASKSYFIRTLHAGSSFHDAVLVTNVGAAPVSLVVAPVAAVTAATTGIVYAQGRATGDATWIHSSVSSVRVPAHATVPVDFTVTAPTDAAAGTHLAGLAFTNPAAVTSAHGQLAIKTYYRNVMGILTTVSGPARAQFRLPTASIGAAKGTALATVTLQIANVGRLLDHGTLTVTLARGASHRTVTRTLNMILPGDTVDYAVAWPTSLAAGRYHVTAALSGVNFPTATLDMNTTLADATAGGPNAPLRPFSIPGSKTGTKSAQVLMSVLLAALLLGGATATWFVVVRRRRSSTLPQTPAQAARTEDLVNA